MSNKPKQLKILQRKRDQIKKLAAEKEFDPTKDCMLTHVVNERFAEYLTGKDIKLYKKYNL